MSVWRPAPTIRVKALGLVWRAGKLLASEIYRDDGSVKGVRPLGGGIAFGESWQDALIREFDEELGVPVTIAGPPRILENIYSHHGEIGHEVCFVADLTLPDDAYPDDGPIEYFEDNGQRCVAHWFDVDDLDQGGLELYPRGLKAVLRGASAD